jgi:hypothetical protein
MAVFLEFIPLFINYLTDLHAHSDSEPDRSLAKPARPAVMADGPGHSLIRRDPDFKIASTPIIAPP